MNKLSKIRHVRLRIDSAKGPHPPFTPDIEAVQNPPGASLYRLPGCTGWYRNRRWGEKWLPLLWSAALYQNSFAQKATAGEVWQILSFVICNDCMMYPGCWGNRAGAGRHLTVLGKMVDFKLEHWWASSSLFLSIRIMWNSFALRLKLKSSINSMSQLMKLVCKNNVTDCPIDLKKKSLLIR